MKKIIIILAFMIIVSGCSQEIKLPEDVHTGTEGIEINFLEDRVPDEVYDGSILPLAFEMRNKGAFSVQKGVVGLSVENEYMNIRTDEFRNKLYEFSINGRSEFDPYGGFIVKTVEIEAGIPDPQSETHTSLVSISACYPYKTEAQAQVCVDTDVLGLREVEKPCTPSEIIGMGTVESGGEKLPRGQGAPIAVTRIEQKMSPHDHPDLVIPEYTIYIRNMGEGIPVDTGLYENGCRSSGLPKDSVNVVSVSAYLSDRYRQMDCKPKQNPDSAGKEAYVRLGESQNEDFIRCTYSEGIQKSAGTYTTPLLIDISYGYMQTISKSFLIRKNI